MWGKKIESVKKLARKAKSISPANSNYKRERPSPREYLLRERFEADQELISSPSTTPTGNFAVYVGEERQRFVVPTGYLGHPLFKMLLEKASDEFGFNQNCGLVVPCSVATFEEVINAVQGCNGKFQFGDLMEEFI